MGVEALGFWDEGLLGGVPMLKMVVSWGLCWGSASSGNYQLGTYFQSHVSSYAQPREQTFRAPVCILMRV